MKFGLTDKIVEKIKDVFEENSNVDKAIIFGSRAKGNYKPGSDIDIALKGQYLTFDDILKLHTKLDDLNLAHEIDLLNYDTIKEPALKEHIDRAGIEFYSRWKKFVLDEVISKFVDYRGKTPKKTLAGIPLITAKIIKEGRILEPNEFIAEEDYESWMTRGFPEKNDIILTTEAPLGEVALIKNTRIALAQRIITLKTKKEICDSIFLKYYLESNEGQGVLQARASGSTVEGIKASELKKIEVKLPPLTDQKQISSILLSLDDKIDLLHHQNKILEQLAETLFTQWFVEEAKESWEIGKLRDVLELVYGKALKEEMRTGTGFPVIGSSGVVGYHSEYLIEGPGIIIGRKGTLGKVIYMFESFFPIDTTYFLKSKINSIGLFYEYFLLKTLNFEEMNSDSAVPGLNRDIALSTEVKIAPKERLKEFNSQCLTLFKKIESNTIEIKQLTQIRDTLLPKLMSGEVRIN